MEFKLKITDTLARKIYPGATPELKSIMEESCGGKSFFEQKITDRVNSLDDVFEVMDIDQDDFYSGYDTPSVRAFKEMELVTKCLNEGWIPDWNDYNERKWHLWFEHSGPSGFRLGGVLCTHSLSDVGSRLVFKSENLARHAFKIIPDSYRIYHTFSDR
jgi:hypothetical protein